MNELESLKNKIKYRSSYRGTKEMDLLLTSFVSKYIDIFFPTPSIIETSSNKKFFLLIMFIS